MPFGLNTARGLGLAALVAAGCAGAPGTGADRPSPTPDRPASARPTTAARTSPSPIPLTRLGPAPSATGAPSPWPARKAGTFYLPEGFVADVPQADPPPGGWQFGAAPLDAPDDDAIMPFAWRPGLAPEGYALPDGPDDVRAYMQGVHLVLKPGQDHDVVARWRVPGAGTLDYEFRSTTPGMGPDGVGYRAYLLPPGGPAKFISGGTHHSNNPSGVSSRGYAVTEGTLLVYKLRRQVTASDDATQFTVKLDFAPSPN